MKNNLTLFGIFCWLSFALAAMEERNTHLVVIAGQNGLGGNNTSFTLPQFNGNKKKQVENPKFPWHDLGQKNCIAPLASLMAGMGVESNAKPKVIIHGSSQGTATAINYAAQNPDKVHGLILEGVLASGNSAIHHTIKTIMFPRIANLPLSYYWLPYCAKVAYPSYAPAGKQPINQLEKLPKNLPVIIIHSTTDPQLPYSDALAVYYGLKKLGNPNVYLIPRNKYGHVELLDVSDRKEIDSIHAILDKHGLVAGHENQNSSEVDLFNYQPTISSEPYDNLIAKEKKMRIVDFGLKTTLFSCVGYMVYRQFPDFFSKFGNYAMNALGKK